MANEVKLPSLGENVASGDVIEVKVAVGDVVQKGQPLIEVEAEKTTAEVPTPVAGKVTQVLVKTGDKVKKDQVIAIIDGANGQAPPRHSCRAAKAAPPAEEAAGRRTEAGRSPREAGRRGQGCRRKPLPAGG